MSFDWSLMLLLARDLTRSPTPGERELRTAINRAYYAAYHVGATYARQHWQHNPDPKKHSVHASLWECFRVHNMVPVATQGDELKKLRIEIDYYSYEDRNLRNQALTALGKAGSIFHLLTGSNPLRAVAAPAPQPAATTVTDDNT